MKYADILTVNLPETNMHNQNVYLIGFTKVEDRIYPVVASAWKVGMVIKPECLLQTGFRDERSTNSFRYRYDQSNDQPLLPVDFQP